MLAFHSTRKATRAAQWCVVGLAVVALSACGPLRPRMPAPDPALDTAVTTAEAVAAEVRARSTYPTLATLADQVVLYTPMMEDLELARESSGGQTARARSLSERRRLAMERDTIRGRILVHQWLVRRRDEGGDSVPFLLRTEQVFQCDGAVLQYGRYRLPRRRAELVRVARQHPVEIAWEVPFTARWSDPADGPLEMEALWLGPLSREVTPTRLAENCTDTKEPAFTLAYTRRRWAVEGAVGYTLQQGAPGVVEDALDAQGWPGDRTGSAPYWAELGVFRRIRPGWQLEGLGSYQAPGTVRNHRAPLYDATLTGTAVVAGGLLLAELGPVRLGAGPAVSFARWHWSDTDVTQPATSAASTLFGGLLEMGYVQNFHSHVYLHLRGRYGVFPDAETPGFRDLGPVTVPMSGARLSVGVGYWW